MPIARTQPSSAARWSIAPHLLPRRRPMGTIAKDAKAPAPARAAELFDQHWRDNARRTDRMFAVLMVLQWIGAVILALFVSPRGWEGSQSHVHPHVWLALYLGAALASLPVYFAW